MEGLRLTGLVLWSFLLLKVAWTSKDDPFPFVTGDFSDCESLVLGCLPGWEKEGASCFKVIEIPLKWSDAQTLCRRDNANLVLVRDIQEAQQAGELFNRWQSGQEYWEPLGEDFWIGLQFKAQGYNVEYGNVTFVQGTEVPAIRGPWREGQPDNSGDKYCAVSSSKPTFNRAMRSCLETRYAICERPATQSGDRPCAVNGEVIPRSHVCNGDRNCPDGSDELCDQSCRFRLHIADSPMRYSQIQARAEECVWFLGVSPTRSINIKVNGFKSGDPRKVLKIFCVLDGKNVLIGTVADRSGDEVTYHCDSMEAWVQFLHDNTYPRIADFTIAWEEVPRESGTMEAGPEAVLYSIGMSQEHVYNRYFYQLFVARDGTPITFKFSKIDPNPGQMLRLFDGPSQTDNLLLTLEHGSRYDVIDNVAVTSTGSHVQLVHDIKFMTLSGAIEFEYYTGCDVEMEANAGVILSPGFPAQVRRPLLCTYQLQVPEGRIYMSWSIGTASPQLSPYDRLDIFVGDSDVPEYSGYGDWNNKYNTEDDKGITLNLVSSQAYSSSGFEAIFTIGCKVDVKDDANYLVYPADREHLPPGEVLRLSPSYGYYFNQEELNGCSYYPTPVTVRCEKGGRWSRQIPTKASPIQCRPPTQPRSGYVYSLTGTYVGDEATFLCFPGFHLIGQHTAHCRPDGTWEGIPECRPVNCRPLVAPENGHIQYRSTYQGDKNYFSVATVVCDRGYEVVGTKEAFCTRYGTWDIKLPMPVCIPVNCGLPPAWPRFVPLWPRPDGTKPPDFSPPEELDPPAETTYGKKFWASCKLGYTLKGSSPREVKCGPDAEWLIGDLECVETVCPKSMIWKPAFAYQWPADREVFYYDDVVTYLCHPNHVVEKTESLHARLHCGPYGTWSDTVPKCVPAKCRVPTLLSVKVAPTDWSHARGSMVPHGTVVTFKCGQEVRSRECKVDVKFDLFHLKGDSFECGGVNCWSEWNIPGFVPPTVSTTVGSAFTYSCKDGSTPEGSSSRGDRIVTCLSSGNWDLGSLRCTQNLCPDPGRPADGGQHSTSYEEGAEVTFSCMKPGFIPNPAAIKCMWDGQTSTMGWNVSVSIQSPPVCEDNQMPVFPGCPLGPEEVELYDVPADNQDWIPYTGYYDNHVVERTLISRNPYAPIYQDVNVTLSAIDYSGQTGICNWEIKVKDETPPDITCPSEVTIKIPLDHVGPFPIPLDKYDDADSPFRPGDGTPRFNLPEDGQEAPPDSSPHVVTVEYISEDESDNEAQCQVPINFIGHTCNRYNHQPWRLQPTCSIVGPNKKTCVMQCPQGEGKRRVFYGTDSPIYSLVCETSGDNDEDGAWEEEKEFPDCVELTQAVVKEQPDENSPIVKMVQGLDLEVDPGQCTPEDIQPAIETLATGIQENARDNSLGNRNCEIDVGVAVSDYDVGQGKAPDQALAAPLGLHSKPYTEVADCPMGAAIAEADYQRLSLITAIRWVPTAPERTAAAVSIRFTITRSQVVSAIDDLEGCKDRVTNALATSPFTSFSVSDCNGSPAVINGEISQQGDGMIDCELGLVTRPPGECEECPLGHFYREDQCRECPKDTYQDQRKAFGCKQCPPNTYSSRPGSRSVDECTPFCPPGTTGDANHLPPCTRCPADTYWVLNQCMPCQNGKITDPNILNIGPESCKFRCQMGTYSELGYTESLPCKSCPKGFYQDEEGEKICKPCPLSTQTTASVGATDAAIQCVAVGDSAWDPLVYCPNCPDGCTIQDNVPLCNCEPGKTGMFCEITIDPCAPGRIPCHNGGTCTPDQQDTRGYTCNCPAPFIGIHCETDGNVECTGVQCGNPHAGCRDEDSGYTCLCPNHLASTGTSCGTVVDLCSDNPCGIGGSCSTTKLGVYSVCTCKEGYTGRYCETEINECKPSPCSNGGTCIDKVGAWECACPRNFYGEKCEIMPNDQCTPGQCDGRGQCEINHVTGMAFCQCFPGYTEYSSPCLPSPCEGQAPCEDKDGGFECDCPPGRLGDRCEIECRPLEINFLVDVSRAVQPMQHEQQKKIIKELTENLDRHSGGYRVIQFSNTASVEITASRPEPFREQLEDLGLPKFRLHRQLSDGFKMGVEEFDDSYTQILLLFYYGSTGMSMDKLREAWMKIKNNEGTVGKIYPVVLAIGDAVLEQELTIMNETYKDTEIFRLEDMDNFKETLEQVLHYLCTIHAVNPCSMNPCRNGGECVHDPRAQVEEDYYCRCRQGFIGKNCETDVLDRCLSPCTINPCKNDGVCLDITTCRNDGPNGYDHCNKLQNGFYCLCGKSSGVLCDVPHHICAGNNEECCGPEFPYIGEDCEIGLPESCSMWHCRHGGTCHVDTNLWGAKEVKCTCPPGFTGDRCEEKLDRCEDNECKEDSECLSVSNNYYCKCSEYAYGDRCQFEKNICDLVDVCSNGGICELNDYGEPTCDCSNSEHKAWIGDYCDCEMRGPCHPARPCLNGGTCTDKECHCLPGYSGTFCQYYKSECELKDYGIPPTCYNDGEWDEDACRCKCPCPWGGWDCSKRAMPYFLEVFGVAVIQTIQTFDLPRVHTVSLYVRSTSFYPPRTVLRLYTKETPMSYNDNRELLYTLTTTSLIITDVGPIVFNNNVFTNDDLHRFVIVWDPEDRGGVTLYIDGLESGFLDITSSIDALELQPYGFITMAEHAPNQPPFEGTLAGLLVADRAFNEVETLPSVIPDYDCLLPFYPDLDLWGYVTWTELSTACVLPKYCPPRLTGRPLLPPSLCPDDVYVWKSGDQCVSSPFWKEPELKILPPDVYPYVKTCSTMQPATTPVLQGKYEVSLAILDTARYTSRMCTFNILIPSGGECKLPQAPLHGPAPACFRIYGILTCRLGCPSGLALIRDTSDLVTCHVDGTWRFANDVILDPRDPILVPPCGVIRPPEVTVWIGVSYRLDSWQGPWEDSIRNKLTSAVSQINTKFGLCHTECDTEVDIENRQPTVRATVRISRMKYFGEGQPYYGGIDDKTYPVDDLVRAITDEKAFSLHSVRTGSDISGDSQLSWKQGLSCPKLHQLVRDKCVECPPGTYYSEDSSRCEFCPIGQYMDQAGQVQCRPCGTGLTTAQVGTSSFQGCIFFCVPGQRFNLETRRCEQCLKGFYQPFTNFTYCFCCPPTFTSQPGAASINSCYEACPPGTFSNSTFYGTCRPCPPDTYASQPGSEECTPCPKHYQTEGGGHASRQACKDMCYMEPDYCALNTTCVWDDELETATCQCNHPSCQPPKPPVEPPVDTTYTVIALAVGGAVILLVLFCFGIWMCLRRRDNAIEEREKCPSVVTTTTGHFYPVGVDTIVKRWKPNHATILTSPAVNVMGMSSPNYSTPNCSCGTQPYSTQQHLGTQPTATQMTYSPQTTEYSPLTVKVKQEPARMVLGTARAQSTGQGLVG